MNLIRIGDQTFNLSLVMRYREHPIDPDAPVGSTSRRLELIFVNGATTALEGDDAESMRRYLIANSTTIELVTGEGEFAADREGVVFSKTPSGKQGT